MKDRYLLLLLALVLGLAFSARPAPAAPPDAGQMLNRQRQPEIRLPDRLPTTDDQEAEKALPSDVGTAVVVKAFRFSGYEGLAKEAELQALVHDSIGKKLVFFDLQRLAEQVTAFLRDQKGYLLARAYLPSQDITDGIIEIIVIAGRIDGSVRVNVKEPRRISQELLEKIAQKAIATGEAIRMADLERAVLLMKDLPGITAHASLEPGTAPGSTRVGIDVAEGPLMGGMVSGDNYGDRYTGIWRGTGQVTANDPFGLGDRLSLSVTGAEHMAQGSITYALPLGTTGMAGSVSYTGFYYELGEDLASLDVNGRADTFAANLTYPLLRSRKTSVWTGLGLEYLMLKDEAGGAITSQRRLPVGKATLFATLFDSLGGGGLNSASLSLYYGHLDLMDVTGAQALDDAGPRSAGTFNRGTYSLARLQRLTRSVSLFGSVRGQMAGANLDSSQKFILGGPTGVRAFPVGEASGDEGHAMTVETRFDLPPAPAGNTVQLVGFFDAGWIKLHKDPWTASVTNATGRNDYWLSGGGLGVSIGKEGLYSIRASYAHEIGGNPGRSTTGKDVDNCDDDGRFWIQAVAWF